MERYFLEPYRFIPPFRSTFWCRLARRVIPRHLRRKMGVVRWQFEGTDVFQESLSRNAGVLLTPNHCRWADPLVMGVFGIQARQYLYYVASYHLFRQSRVMGWVLNRIGGYSIWREGSDRESIRTTARILAEAERPVVLFPEGTWFRQNDRVGPLQDGLSLITRQAAKQSVRPVVVHPVGIKYWLLEDPLPELNRRLGLLERRFNWRPQELPIVERVEKLTGAVLALKEIEYTGGVQAGTLDERTARLMAGQVERIEKDYLGKTFDGWVLERIRRLRQLLSRRLLEEKDEPAAGRYRKDLDALLFCENINAHAHDYLLEHPGPERQAEAVQRLEEILTDEMEVAVVPMGVTVTVGPAVDVREFAGRKGGPGGDPLVQHLRTAIQERVDYLRAKGPPPEWGAWTPGAADRRAVGLHSPPAPAPAPVPAAAALDDSPASRTAG